MPRPVAYNLASGGAVGGGPNRRRRTVCLDRLRLEREAPRDLRALDGGVTDDADLRQVRPDLHVAQTHGDGLPDLDKARRIVLVRGTKTHKSRREVPLTAAALAALDSVPPRIDSRYVFTTSRKCPGSNEPGPFDMANFRRRVWAPAIDSAGIAKPARIYDLRSTFISNALANGLTVFETARVAGTSVKMIELHYGALLDTAHESILERLEVVR